MGVLDSRDERLDALPLLDAETARAISAESADVIERARPDDI